MEVDSDEDMDYMSDSFVVATTNDIRPGLLFNRTQQRHHDEEKKRKESALRNKIKPRRVLEEEQRSKALATPIVPNNIGFAMMQKMGFQPGTALGKPGTSGLMEPIAPVLKSDRQGLGRETELKRKIDDNIQRSAKRLKEEVANKERLENDYVHRLRNKIEEKKTMGYLRKGQKICEYLDCKKGLTEPEQNFFWLNEESTLGYSENYEISDTDTSSTTSETDDEEEEEQLCPEEKLQHLVTYLRSNHRYCIWCATSFDDENDLRTNCPGPTAKDHD